MGKQKTTPCQTPLAHVLSSSISGLSPETSEVEVARLQSRATLVEMMFARFTAASGTEIPTDRRIALIEMLNAHGFTYSQFQAAEVWILRGAPCRFGKITYADFYPTHEQLDSVGYDIAGIERRAREAGYRMGFDAGVAQTTEVWREEVRKMREKCAKKRSLPRDNSIQRNRALEHKPVCDD